MRLVKYVICLAVLSSCASAPKPDICISRPESGGLLCEGDESYFKPYSDTDKMLCTYPAHLQRTLEYIKRQLDSRYGQ